MIRGGVDKKLILAALRMVESRAGHSGRVGIGRFMRGFSISIRQEGLANVIPAETPVARRSVRCNGLTEVVKGEGLVSKS